MEVLPRGGGEGAVSTSLYDCIAVSVSVTDLGSLATDGLKFVASKTGDKFSELLLLPLWRSYFGVKSILAISDDGIGVLVSSHTTFMMWKWCFIKCTWTLFMFGFDLMSSFWISIAGRSPRCLPSRLINTVLSAVIFGKGTGAKLISHSAQRPLRDISESIVDCMSVVRKKKPPLFKSRLPVRSQSSLVCVISKMSSCVGFGSVSSLSQSLVVFVPPSERGGGLV